jgi:hypothetical protein
MGEGLTLDFESHSYAFDGVPVGGVSEMMAALGMVERSYFDDWSRDRGAAVHLALEYWMDNRIDWSTIDPRIKGYVEAGVRFVEDAKMEQPIIERAIFDRVLRLAGTPDLICIAFGDPCVPDFKTGAIGLAGVATAAYERAARVRFPVEKPRRRMAVQLFQDGKYKKTDLRDPYDYVDVERMAGLFNKYHLPRKIAALKGASDATPTPTP